MPQHAVLVITASHPLLGWLATLAPRANAKVSSGLSPRLFHFTHQPSSVPGIYQLLDSGTTFDRADELLKATGLYDYTQVVSSRFSCRRCSRGQGDPAGQVLGA